jgi:hypothetical protein
MLVDGQWVMVNHCGAGQRGKQRTLLQPRLLPELLSLQPETIQLEQPLTAQLRTELMVDQAPQLRPMAAEILQLPILQQQPPLQLPWASQPSPTPLLEMASRHDEVDTAG